MTNKPSSAGYAVLCTGTADFIRDFGIDLAEVLEDVFGEEARGLDDVSDPSLLGPTLGPRADVATGLLVGFVMLLPSWIAKKVESTSTRASS